MFKQAYIPKRLTEVLDFERDINLVKSGEIDDLVYKTLVGLKADLSGTTEKPEILQKNKVNESCSESSDSESDTSNTEDCKQPQKFVNSSRPKHESLEEKKARKKAVKDAQAEKRKEKIKKHIKKRNEKARKKQ